MSEVEIKIPIKGIAKDDLLKTMQEMREDDVNWKSGKTWSLVFFAGEEHMDLLHKAYNMFMSENGLSPIAFPSLKKMENDVLAAAASMLGGEEAVGTMTTGGTESIFMAMKSYRQWARQNRPEITKPEILLPISAHPAFEKAAHYLDLKTVHAPVADDLRVDMAAMKDLLNESTIALVGSAPGYPHGVIDPIEEIAALAQEHGVGMHVDSCLGGFILPWLDKLGYDIPPFNFQVPGVTSMSADIHKYGYGAKGASIVLYKNAIWRRHQFYAYTAWPGGIYASPSMTGTRPGGAIAASWAAIHGLGQDGYLRMAESSMNTAQALMDGINAIDALNVMGKPDMTVFAFTSKTLDVYALGDAMDRHGWHLDRNQFPASLHLMVTANHKNIVEPFLKDLAESVEEVRNNPNASSEGSAAMYGMMASLPERTSVDEFAIDFIDGLFTPGKK